MRITLSDIRLSPDIIRRLASSEDMTPLMTNISEILLESVEQNFISQGRPTRWAATKPKTLARRIHGGTKTLIDKGASGGLLGSLAREVVKTQNGYKITVFSGKEYAAVMQFGASKGEFGTKQVTVPAHRRAGRTVREHTRRMAIPWGNIHARPFLVIQTEDMESAKAAIINFVNNLG